MLKQNNCSIIFYCSYVLSDPKECEYYKKSKDSDKCNFVSDRSGFKRCISKKANINIINLELKSMGIEIVL